MWPIVFLLEVGGWRFGDGRGTAARGALRCTDTRLVAHTRVRQIKIAARRPRRPELCGGGGEGSRDPHCVSPRTHAVGGPERRRDSPPAKTKTRTQRTANGLPAGAQTRNKSCCPRLADQTGFVGSMSHFGDTSNLRVPPPLSFSFPPDAHLLPTISRLSTLTATPPPPPLVSCSRTRPMRCWPSLCRAFHIHCLTLHAIAGTASFSSPCSGSPIAVTRHDASLLDDLLPPTSTNEPTSVLIRDACIFQVRTHLC